MKCCLNYPEVGPGYPPEEEDEELTAEEVDEIAERDAAGKALEAIASIEIAKQECGDCLELQRAIDHLRETTVPLARGAAEAQTLIHIVLMTCPPAAEKKALAITTHSADSRDCSGEKIRLFSSINR